MTRGELLAFYRQILTDSPSLMDAIGKISAHVNTLVWTASRQPLSEAEKTKILEEIFDNIAFRKSFPNLESIDKIHGSVNEADNSHILDVISALKRGAKG